MKLNKLIILIGIAIIAMCVLKKMGVVEEFYCQNCNQNGWRGESSCATCGNCGWCIDPNGSGSCVSGTAAGPLFADCSSWYYGGQCQWGAECDGVRPGYIITYPWYNPWGWYGRWNNWWRRPRPWWRRHRRYHGPRRHGGRRWRRIGGRRNPMGVRPMRRMGGGGRRMGGGRRAGGGGGRRAGGRR